MPQNNTSVTVVNPSAPQPPQYLPPAPGYAPVPQAYPQQPGYGYPTPVNPTYG
eukprot:CAMPEP_0170495190 /NCGR_PEP_ID=MMETSP0208-20121228/15068_1 /TAXON_ID=197538 /ORGANISM="Strombidium inclinatum, Strain S3" /LENGTH=52 /DNA_ID=CAMNT_0010771347 /DNA_START=429 /DNA_END=587 /DNA_ORIENTATION=+